jgi:YggT family protein
MSLGIAQRSRRTMDDIIGIVRLLLLTYFWIIIASAVLSWLIGFGFINYANPQVRQLWKLINAVTEPVLAPIRRLLPSTAGIDFSPLVVCLVLQVIIGFLH